jgi:hypothetical protein
VGEFFNKKVIPLFIVAGLVICLVDITSVNAFKINTVTIEPPNGVSDFDLDYYIIFDDDGVGKVYHNKKASQDTLKVHKGDFLSGDIHPHDDEASSLKAFFTKSFKVKTHSLTFDKKYNLKNLKCFGDNIHCNVFSGDVPTNINKGTYQFVVFTSDEELYRYYITKATVK